jgi:endonuclease/exonuclease/phosphatase family metal-dependent hydrolase
MIIAAPATRCLSRCARLLPVLLALGGLPALATAQTTVVLDAPDREVNADTTIRGGGYAAVNYSTNPILESKKSVESSTRRILLKFDTQNFVPAGAIINSAKLSVVLKTAEDSTSRPIGAYRITQSFSGPEATWLDRKQTSRWRNGGGDLGEKFATAYVGNSVGSTYTFDLTQLVQRAVKGEFGSRYTRVALVDTGASSGGSYRSFHSTRASNTAVRPKLVISYGSAPSLAATTGGTTLRVMQWNIHKGRNSSGRYDPNTDANWIVKHNVDIVSLNEVSYFNAYSGNEDTAAKLQSLLQQKTGRTWYKVFVRAQSSTGNAILSRLRPTATSVYSLSYSRSVARLAVMVNGIQVNVFSTHVDYSNAYYRTTQIKQAKSWISTFAKPRIVMGDFNTSPGTSDYYLMANDSYGDSWAKAKSAGTATSFNGTGATKGSSRFDYVWNRGTNLILRSVNVPDTRTNGVYASDHNPVVAVFTVR